jgi:hypothetical protein
MSIIELQTELRRRDRHVSDRRTRAPHRAGRLDPDLVVVGAFALIGLLASLGLWSVVPVAEVIGMAGSY